MKQVFDTNSYLFQELNTTEIRVALNGGGVYNGLRPLNSKKEDIVVNTIVLSQQYAPQLGTSNVNIHVPDIDVKIDGVSQKMPDNAKMKSLSELVLSKLRATKIEGVGFTIESQNVIAESEIKQHYVNIRINWFIH